MLQLVSVLLFSISVNLLLYRYVYVNLDTCPNKIRKK